MKNKFLLLLILGVTFFASCSDDDDDKVRTYNGDKLTLSVSGIDLSGREAVLDGSILTLKQALPGEGETAFTITREGNKMTGVNSNANREVTLNGTIDGDKLGLDLTLKAKSSMTAKWSVKTLFLNVETSQEEIELDGQKVPVEEILETINGLGGIIPLLLPALSFEEDGNILATYNGKIEGISDIFSPKPENYVVSPKGMALYNVVDNKIYVVLNLNKIIEDATTSKAEVSNEGRSDYNPLESLMAMVETGLPLYLRDGEEGIKEVYVDRDMMLPVVKMLPALLQAYGSQLGDMKETVEMLVQMISTLIEGSTKTELGLQLAPYTETPTPVANVQSLSKMIENASLKFVK